LPSKSASLGYGMGKKKSGEEGRASYTQPTAAGVFLC
jgi:hypothetical protein